MKPHENLGQPGVMFLSSALSTGGGGKLPPSYHSTQRTRKIEKLASKTSRLSEEEFCGYCGKALGWSHAVEIGNTEWHVDCFTKEIRRREAEL